jgi:hypothetical protein
MYGDSGYRPAYQGARLTNHQHRGNRRDNAAITKLMEAITNIDGNVLQLANAMVNGASPAVRARLMDLVVAIIFAESDAYVYENDDSEGPRNAMELVEKLNECGIVPKP